MKTHGLEPPPLLFKMCFLHISPEALATILEGTRRSEGIIVLHTVLMNASVSSGVLLEGLTILGKVLGVDVNSLGALEFTSKH